VESPEQEAETLMAGNSITFGLDAVLITQKHTEIAIRQ
jgi:hypothetical protein